MSDLKDMTPRDRVYETCYELRFFVDRGGGLAFPCDEKGNIYWDTMTDGAKENYEYALAHPEEYPYSYNEVFEYETSHVELATGVCSCGHRISLYDQYLGACECPYCGKWYSLSGQELLPPNKWGWDGTPMDDDY